MEQRLDEVSVHSIARPMKISTVCHDLQEVLRTKADGDDAVLRVVKLRGKG